MRKTMTMVHDMCESVNVLLAEKGSRYYYRVNTRYGYRAIDKYRKDDNGADVLADTVRTGLTTGQAYDALVLTRDALCLCTLA